jgi:hypothetical protein
MLVRDNICGALTKTVMEHRIMLSFASRFTSFTPKARSKRKKKDIGCLIYASTASILTGEPEGNCYIDVEILQTSPCGQGATIIYHFCIRDQLTRSNGRFIQLWSIHGCGRVTAENSRCSLATDGKTLIISMCVPDHIVVSFRSLHS